MTVETIDRALLGKPVKGPSALAGDPRRFLHLTWTLATTEFRLKFFGSVLGYLWQLFKPLLLFGVMLVVFTKAVRLGHGVYQYPVVLLMAIVLFTFFSESTSAAVPSLVDREGLVRKIQFPRLVIPVSILLTSLFNLALNFTAVLVFMLARGVYPRWSWFELVPLVLLLTVFAGGVSMLVSALFVRYRDVRPIWEVAVQALFYGSAIFYAVETIPTRFRHLVMCNPLAAIIQQTRHAVIDPHAPSAADAIGGGIRLLIPLGIVVGVAVLGFWVFNREAPRIAEEL